MPTTLALTELLGLSVYDSTGTRVGKVREVALVPQEDPQRVSALVVRTRAGDYLLNASSLRATQPRIETDTRAADWPKYAGGEGMLLLGRDLLDQQIIDVNGRKVVRVNDVELQQEQHHNALSLRVGAVDVGGRGAVRRLFKGVVPSRALRASLGKVPPRLIPWDFVDLIETDPSRRVRLKIEMERLARLHPADIADILEELAPAERDAVFATLDEEVAAEALEEMDPKLQAQIVSALDSDKAADIVEEMDPDAAADLLGDLDPERSEEILEEMEPEQREEVEDLLEFEEDTAAGRMTTDYLSLPPTATVADAIEMLRAFEGDVESVNTIFIVDGEKLAAAVPIPKLLIATPDTPLLSLFDPPLISVGTEASEKDFAELFDKYNLITLPVVDENGHLAGIITADDVISLLRSKI